MIGIAAREAAIMVRDQRRQRHRRALFGHRAITERRDMPARIGRVEAARASLLAADRQIVKAGNRLARQRPSAIELDDNPRKRPCLGPPRAAPSPDKHLTPGAPILWRGKGDATGRQHRDIAAISAVEDAKAPVLEPAKIEGMLDDLAKTRCFDRV